MHSYPAPYAQCCALGPPSDFFDSWRVKVDSKQAAMEKAVENGHGFNPDGTPVCALKAFRHARPSLC